MKRVLLLFILLLTAVNGANAYEFPFTLIKFKPHFFRMDGNHLVYKYVDNFTSETLLKKNLKINDLIFEKTIKLLAISPDDKKIKIYIYKSVTQKRKMMGSIERSNIEDGFIHVAINSPNFIIGNIVPLLASQYFGRCESIFINKGLRYIYKPIISNYGVDELENIFNECGMMRKVDLMLDNEYISHNNDEITMVSSASFVKFLLTQYPLTFFWKWYGTPIKSYEDSFKKIYGFSIQEAEIQWHENMNKIGISDKKFSKMKEELEKHGIKLR